MRPKAPLTDLEGWSAEELRQLVLDGAAGLEDFAGFVERRLRFRAAPQDGPGLIAAQASAALAIEELERRGAAYEAGALRRAAEEIP